VGESSLGKKKIIQTKNMLIGEYNHILDTKKRLSLPSKFRRELGERVVVTHGLDHCLFVYPIGEWEKIAEKLSNLPMGASDMRSFNRFLLAGAVETEIDSMGRILIPDFLKEFAGLKSKVSVVGIHTRIELWDEEEWNKYKSKVSKEADKLAEKLGEIGVI